jgi:hypothetical protein
MSKRTKESIDPKADPIREQVIAAMDSAATSNWNRQPAETRLGQLESLRPHC